MNAHALPSPSTAVSSSGALYSWGDGRFGGVRMRSISAAAPLNSLLSSTEAASKRARDAGDGARRGTDFAGDGALEGGLACRSALNDSE